MNLVLVSALSRLMASCVHYPRLLGTYPQLGGAERDYMVSARDEYRSTHRITLPEPGMDQESTTLVITGMRTNIYGRYSAYDILAILFWS